MNAKCLLLFLLLQGAVALAQPRRVEGTVTDEAGSPLAGVSVSLQGTSLATQTEASGYFSLDGVQPQQSVLQFSYVGYETLTVPVGSDSRYDVTLQRAMAGLDEVVVVAYGVQKKANLTGAVSSLQLHDVKNIPVSNTAALLQGRMGGVTVSSFSAQPGKADDVEIRIRGIGTFGDNNPMVIIDGVQGELSSVAPGDIESLTVLKDAASAAIYGVRAANGVILVTTKRGSSDRRSLSYNGSYGQQRATVVPDYVDSWDWAMLYNEQAVANGAEAPYTDAMIQQMRDGSNPDYFANTDWGREVYRTARMQNHHLAMSGGSATSKYMASLGYVDQEGILIGTSSDRVNLRLNADTRYLDKLTMGLNVSGYMQQMDEPYRGATDVLEAVKAFSRPTVPLRYSNGQWGFFDGQTQLSAIRNPVHRATVGYNQTETHQFAGQAFADLEPIKNLHIKSNFSYSYRSSPGYRYIPTDQPTRPDGTPQGEGTLHNTATQSSYIAKQWINENIVTYNLETAGHTLGLLVGQSAQYNGYREFAGWVQDFPSNDVHELSAGVNSPGVSGSSAKATLLSFFGRVNYAYADRYLFEANIRGDRSSRIPRQNRLGVFPSFSAGWIVSNEPFMADQRTLSALKLRLSWGRLGNQEIGYYPYSQGIALNRSYVWGTGKAPGVAIANLANSDISWETTTITDVGIDAGLWKDRLTLTFDYFDKRTADILLELPIPATQGWVSAPYVNAAAVRNRGWEADLGYRDYAGELSWGASINLTKVNNEITDVNGREDWIEAGRFINLQGHPIGALYGYVSDGLYRTEAELGGVTHTLGDVGVGDLKLLDLNGDGQVDQYDRTVVGNPFPDLTYGVNLSIGYKGIDFNAFVQGVGGVDRFYMEYPRIAGNVTTAFLDRYEPTSNPDGDYPRLGNENYNSVSASHWVVRTSYLRLKNLELGYTLPKHTVGKLRLQQARFFLSAQNLLTFTDLAHWDPEKVVGDVRNHAYPNAKTVSLGINLQL